MEFLVEIEVSLSPQMAAQERAQLVASEAQRARELKDAGTIVRLWRIPGRTANVGIWQAADATALHDVLASLPMFPHLRAEVTALATHPVEAERAR